MFILYIDPKATVITQSTLFVLLTMWKKATLKNTEAYVRVVVLACKVHNTIRTSKIGIVSASYEKLHASTRF